MKDFTEPCDRCGDPFHPHEGLRIAGELLCFACAQDSADEDDDIPINIFGETEEDHA